jgi:hypothetical protein
MALVATETAARPIGAYDRVFYSAIAIAAAIVTIVGFSRTYFLRMFDGGPAATISGGPFTLLVHLHGALFTSWVVLFAAQTALVSARRVAVHRRLGIVGGWLAAAMILAGVSLAFATARRGAPGPPDDPLLFFAVPLFDMITFATFVTTALVKRRDKESHKRLMVLAYASLLAAPIGRLPGLESSGAVQVFGLAFAFVVAGVVYDYASRGRVHTVYLWGAPLLLASYPGRIMLGGTAAWHTFARWLLGS